MSKRTMLLVAVLTALALFALPVAPAGALTAGAVVFSGKATVAGPIGIPGSGVGKGVTHTWSFSSGAGNVPPGGLCLGAIVSPKAGKPTSDVGACSISGAGVFGPGVAGLGPWCGHSLGGGAGSIVGASGKTISFSVSWVSGATVLLLTGEATKGGQSGPIVTVVHAFSDVTKAGQSCSNGTATTFLVVGAGAAALLGTK